MDSTVVRVEWAQVLGRLGEELDRLAVEVDYTSTPWASGRRGHVDEWVPDTDPDVEVHAVRIDDEEIEHVVALIRSAIEAEAECLVEASDLAELEGS